jgi:hypothetical protein
MSNNLFESYIDALKTKVGNVRGDSLRKKCDFLLKRWEKIIKDCDKEIIAENDLSAYRRNYRLAHSTFTYGLTAILREDPEEESLYESIVFLSENVKSRMMDELDVYLPDDGYSGIIDACAYMYIELNKALDNDV